MTIRYNPANDFARTLVNLLRQTKAIKIMSDSGVTYEPNAETLEAVDDVKNGRVYHAANTEVEDMIWQHYKGLLNFLKKMAKCPGITNLINSRVN